MFWKKHYKLGYWLLNNGKRHQRHKLQYSLSFIADNSSLTQWCVKESYKSTITPIADSQEQCDNVPSDCIPVAKIQIKYKYYRYHYILEFTQQIPSTFTKYFIKQPYWIQNLTSEEYLLAHIQLETSLLISTDGSKSEIRSRGGFVITLTNGNHLTSDYNPIFGQSYQIHSYRSEIYASFSATLFLYYYRKYFSIPLNNKYTSICDNQSYVNKLTWLLEDEMK